MSNALIVRTALRAGAAEAEKQLALIANNAGDQQLATVIADLTAAEVTVMVSDADMSKPSLAHAFITPEQFAGAFSRLGGRWGEIDSSADWVRLQQDVEDFLCPMILAAPEPTRRKEMLNALLEHELGLDALLFLTLKHVEFGEQIKNPHGYPYARGTWAELTALTYEFFPDKFRDLVAMHHEITADREENEDPEHEFGISFLMSLYEESVRVDPNQQVSTDDFVDI